jgi:hypothetical protein
MQGRQGKGNDPWDRSSSEPHAAVNGNGTGKQRSIPHRPPGMPRVDQPPRIQRVGRPRRETRPPKSLRRRILVRSAIVLVCAIVAFVIAYGAVQFYNATNQAGPSASTAGDFISNISAPNGSTPSYDAAYGDLAPSLRIELTPDQFKQQAQCDDTHYGVITNYSEVSGSATTTATTASYTYTITRSKLAKTYSLHLTLQKAPDNSGNWVITNYNNGTGTDTGNGIPNTLGPPRDTQCS